jgi:hypothetical protein
MSNNLFNKNRYFELLQKQEEILNNYNSCEVELRELLSYQIILESQIFYNNRNLYISFLEQSLRENLTSDFELDLDSSFQSERGLFKFSELYDKNIEDYKVLEKKFLKEGIEVLDNFRIDSNAKEFSELISFIINLDDCDEIYQSEGDMTIILENALSDLRNYSTSTTYNDNEVLILTVIFFTILTSFVYSVLNPTIFNLLWQSPNIFILNIVKI